MPSRPPLYLLVGPEELLLRRAAEQLLDELREDDDLDVTDVRAVDLKERGLPELRTASLFGGRRAVLIRGAQELPAELSAQLLADLGGIAEGTTVILLASGTGRIQKLAAHAKQLGGRVEVAPPKEWDEKGWASLVTEEFRRHGRTADRPAAQALLARAGFDVATIAEKVAQVAATAPPGRITAAHVDAATSGQGSRGSFAVADAMCEREPAVALHLLRGALGAGDDPVLLLGALAYRLRSLVAVAGGVSPSSVGLSLSPGQARRLQALRRNFGAGELTRAYATLAAADLEIKSGTLPAELVLERAVVAIATRS